MSDKLQAERILAGKGVEIILRDYQTDAQLPGSLHDYIGCDLFVTAIFGRVLDAVQFDGNDTLVTCPGIFSGQFGCTSEVSIQRNGQTVFVGLPSRNDMCIATGRKTITY